MIVAGVLKIGKTADAGMPPRQDDGAAAYGFGRPKSLKPKRPLSLIISATFSGTMVSQPASPCWILASTSREKISITDGSLPLIGTRLPFSKRCAYRLRRCISTWRLMALIQTSMARGCSDFPKPVVGDSDG